MRLFLAVFPSAATQELAHAGAAPLRALGEGVAWVRAENLHVTLRFLGQQDELGRAQALEAAVAAARGHAKFRARLGGLGAFPDARRARVLWAGLAQGGEEMRALAASVARELDARGFEHDAQPFTPHVTLGRVRTPGDWSTPLLRANALEGEFEVTRIDLVRSTLAAGGSRYEVVGEAPLARAR